MPIRIRGLVVGLAAGAGAERWLQSAFPNGDNSFHPMALIVVAPMVLAVTFIAAYIPAFRASRLDPMKALRHD